MGYKKSNSMRPDEATGKPGSKLEVNKDETTAAADQERLVSAAMAGEVDDVQQLLGRLGVRIDGFVEEGRHAKLTALMAAAGRGRTDVVRVLLNRRESEKIRMGFGIASMNILRVVWALLTSCVTYPKCWLTDLSKNCFRSFAGKLELMWRTLRVGQFLGKSWETSTFFDATHGLPFARRWCMEFMDRGSMLAKCCWRTTRNFNMSGTQQKSRSFHRYVVYVDLILINHHWSKVGQWNFVTIPGTVISESSSLNNFGVRNHCNCRVCI